MCFHTFLAFDNGLIDRNSNIPIVVRTNEFRKVGLKQAFKITEVAAFPSI